MGFNKKIIGEEQIKSLEKDLTIINHYLKADSIIFTNNDVAKKFKEYEKQCRPE
jgi:hypothetical protein